jgi:hypothetical protein
MVRAASLMLLLLVGCDRPQDYQEIKAEVEIEQLKAEVAQLKAAQKRDRQFADELSNAVSENARTANENSGIDERRWKWTRNHTHQ